MKIRGRDIGLLQSISKEIKQFLANQPGVLEISDDFEEGKSELHICINEPEAARLGLSVKQIAGAVFSAVEGEEATLVREGKEEVAVRVMLDEKYKNEDVLALLPVRNHMGRVIGLQQVTRFRRERGLPPVMHYNGDRVITVGAFIDTKATTSSEINWKLEKEFADIPSRFLGYQLIAGGEWKETKKLVDFMLNAFALASLLIYAILVVQFNSFLQPFILLSAIPVGMVGVVLALILHQKQVSIMGMVGLGVVVVNDAIVLVSFINALRRGGMSTFPAIMQAGEKRFRPILLTSVTTIAGLMPVIYGWGGYEPFIAPAAITISYGLFFASFLTLLVVQSLYLVAMDLKNCMWKMLGAFHPGGHRNVDAKT